MTTTIKQSIQNLANRIEQGEYEHTTNKRTVTDTDRIAADLEALLRDAGMDKVAESVLNLAARVASGEYDREAGDVDVDGIRSACMRIYRGGIIEASAPKTSPPPAVPAAIDSAPSTGLSGKARKTPARASPAEVGGAPQ